MFWVGSCHSLRKALSLSVYASERASHTVQLVERKLDENIYNHRQNRVRVELVENFEEIPFPPVEMMSAPFPSNSSVSAVEDKQPINSAGIFTSSRDMTADKRKNGSVSVDSS